MKKHLLFIALLSFSFLANAQGISGRITDLDGSGIEQAELRVLGTETKAVTDDLGYFDLSPLPRNWKSLQITLFAYGYQSDTITINPYTLEKNASWTMVPIAGSLSEAQIRARKKVGLKYKIFDVHNMGIYASKKTEIIDIDQKAANLATNNARQIYSKVPGLNIWENDGAGLQLSIGARGLSPNRTSNFNTRQNGYDISADALGYPESYYVPPALALKSIEVVRGAASLQYGPQFGGLLNFVLKDGDIDDKLQLTVNQSAGSFKFWNSFISAEGKTNKGIQYYGYFQHKQGDGWRENSNFEQNTAYGSVSFNLGKKIRVKTDFTHMNYLAQQPGGLQDFEFAEDAQMSKRSRNWFKVNWNLASVQADYYISKELRLNVRAFALDASREAIGELGPINRPDPLRERDYVSGAYQNWAFESRLMKRYSLFERRHVALFGVRYYQGFTENLQGNTTDGSGPDFSFLNPNDLEKSAYEFPSSNFAAFVENLFRINSSWTVTPGLRFEHISTNSRGYFKNRVYSGGELIFEQKIEDNRGLDRSLLLAGLGSSYRFKPTLELYTNTSQNYRSVNFSDLSISNPNLLIDSNLMDESGYNIDLGLRGKVAKGKLVFDVSLFYLKYNNRIGLTELVVEDKILGEKLVTYRTNVGNARNLGAEVFAKSSLKIGGSDSQPINLQVFINNSVIDGRYLSGNSSVINKKVEYIPALNVRTGLTLLKGPWSLNYLVSYLSEQYSDATNTEFVSDATRGLIPEYSVHDLNLAFSTDRYSLKVSVNNLLNSSYFTRRALMYPGPGIVPADSRAFYVNLVYRFRQ